MLYEALIYLSPLSLLGFFFFSGVLVCVCLYISYYLFAWSLQMPKADLLRIEWILTLQMIFLSSC